MSGITRLAVVLKQRGISQRRLAQATRLSISRVNRLCCGRMQPREKEKLAISQAVGLEVTELFGAVVVDEEDAAIARIVAFLRSPQGRLCVRLLLGAIR